MSKIFKLSKPFKYKTTLAETNEFNKISAASSELRFRAYNSIEL